MAWNHRRRRPSSSTWAFFAHNPALALFSAIAFVILVFGRMQPALFEDVRGVVDDAGAWVMEILSGPAGELKRWGEGLGSFFSTYEENQRLRQENAKLRASQSELAELQRKVQRFELLLKIPADAPVTAVAARVIADTSGPFVRTILVNIGRAQDVEKGQAVVDDRGLLGRVIATGHRSSRVLLLSDLNSRIPVIVEGENLKAILVGDNSDSPTLEYLPSGSRIRAGSRVVTTSDGASFPPGVAIGIVVKGENSPRVKLFTSEGRADFVRVLSYQAPVDVDQVPTEAVPADKLGVKGSATAPLQAVPPPRVSAPGGRPPSMMRVQ